MADAEPVKASPLYVISGDETRQQGVQSVIRMVMRDHADFKALMVVAVIPTDSPDYDDCRVYATNLNHLEKIGLLDQARDTIK